MDETEPLPRRAVVARLRAAGCVFPDDEADLLIAAADDDVKLEELLSQRVSGTPLEQLLGWAEFAGRRVLVGPGVFVPRRRTELVVTTAERFLGRGDVVVDLCCGSGAVGAVLARSVSGLEVHAVDIDPVAVACARRNLGPVGGQVYQGDLYDPLPGEVRGRVDIITANAPYVPSAEISAMPAEARRYEPTSALDGGSEGLDVLRRVIAGAGGWLAPGGHLVVEAGRPQVEALTGLVDAAGLHAEVVTSDDLDATVVVGSRAGP